MARWSTIILSVLVLLPCRAMGQQVMLNVRVSYVAGQNVYVAAGRAQGLSPGDTLEVLTEGDKIERIEVLSSMSDRSVLRHMGDGFRVQVGSILRILRPGTSEGVGGPALGRLIPETPPDEPLVEESFADDDRTLQMPHTRLKLNGRLVVGVNTLRAKTKSFLQGTEGSSRTYATPFAMISADASGLPYQLDVRIRMRSEYRHVSGGRTASPSFSLRTYEFYLKRQVAGGSLEFGRFSNQHAPAGGYWDGLLFETGDASFGYGASVGFHPVRSNEQVSFDMPKAAAFVNYMRKDDALSNRVEAFYLEIHPTNLLMPRRLLGVRHRLRWKQLSAYNRMEVDRDPESGRWVSTRLSTRLATTLTEGLQAHARYDMRQPYSVYRPFDVISYRRDQFNAGLSVRSRYASVSADLVWNFAYDAEDSRRLDGRSITTSTFLRRVAGFGISMSGSYWWSRFGASMNALLSLTRTVGDVTARVYYQVSGSSRFDTNLTVHSVATEATLPIGKRIRSSTRVRFQTGSYVTSVAFETRISVGLH